MNSIGYNMFVRFHFKMFTPDGSLVADTEDNPMSYIHGIMSTEPPGLGDFLEGKKEGYQDRFIIEKAFGPSLPTEESIQRIPLQQLGNDVQKGMMFAAQVNDKEIPMTVMDIDGDDAIILMGHPLAGYNMTFEVNVLEVRPATSTDLEDIKKQFGVQ